jgi:hypothetical protein
MNLLKAKPGRKGLTLLRCRRERRAIVAEEEAPGGPEDGSPSTGRAPDEGSSEPAVLGPTEEEDDPGAADVGARGVGESRADWVDGGGSTVVVMEAR